MKPRKIALFYGHAASNFGDLAINQGTVNLLRSVNPQGQLQVIFLDSEKSEFLQQAKSSFGNDGYARFSHFRSHGEKSVACLFEPSAFLKEAGVDDADTLLLASGEHLFRYVHGENTGSLFWRAYPSYAARAAGLPCVMLPSTFGPFEDAESTRLMEALIANVDGIAARDSRSQTLLKSHFAVPDLPLLLDPAFFLEPPDLPPGETGVTALVMRSEGWGIRLSKAQKTAVTAEFKDGNYELSTAFQYSLALCQRILADSSNRVRIFVQTVADEELAGALQARLGQSDSGSRVQIYRPLSVADYLLQLAATDRVVASRFHALVMGLVARRPVHAVYFDVHGHKIPGLFDMLGCGDYCISLSDINQFGAVEKTVANFVQEAGARDAALARLNELRGQTRAWLEGAVRANYVRHGGAGVPLHALSAFGGVATELSFASARASTAKQVDAVKRTAEAAQERLSKRNSALEAELAKARTEQQKQQASHKAAQKSWTEVKVALDGKLEQIRTEQRKLQTEFEDAQRAWAKTQSALKAELARVHEAHQQAARASERAWTESQGALQAEVSRLQQELHSQLTMARTAEGAWAVARGALESDLAKLQEELRQRQSAGKATIARLETEIQAYKAEVGIVERRLRGSLSYRWGAILVTSCKQPGRLATLPWALYREWRQFRAEQSDRLALQLLEESASRPAEQGPDATGTVSGRQGHLDGTPDASASGGWTRKKPARRPGGITPFVEPATVAGWIELLESHGLDTVMRVLERSAARLEPRAAAQRLMAAAHIYRDAGHGEAALRLAQWAADRDRSEPTLRALFWLAQKTGQFEAACDALLAIEELLGDGITAEQAERLRKMKVSPAYQLSVLKLVRPKRTPPAVEPVPNRLCYILHNSLPHSSGGYATRSHGVAGGLRGAGCEVVVLTRPGFPLDIKPELQAIDVHETNEIDGIRYIRTLYPLRSGRSLLEYVEGAADALEARLRELRPEVVIAASNHVTGLPSLIAARRLGLRFVYEVRGLWEVTRMSRENTFQNSPAFAVQRLLEAAVCKAADHVFTLTEPMREELIERGVDEAKIDLLPNSCDSERFVPRAKDSELAQRLAIPPSVPVIGYVGTFVDYEGLEDLATACGLLKQQGVEFRLMMVGNENASGQDRGPITEQIAAIAQAEGFGDWLIMPGRVPHEEVERYYSILDICPFPRKPWPVCEMVSPMKPLEALAMEKAVVVSSVRALKEMITNEETGLVFEKGSVESLAAVLMRLIDQPELRLNLGRSGKTWVAAERTWQQIGQKASSVLALSK